MKAETIRFVARDDDEVYFLRAVHDLARGCVLLGAQDDALVALVSVVAKAVEQRQRR